MSSTYKTVIAFDLYGTLLSTESIAKELATHFGDDKASSIATLWRQYQLEYTWRMNSMGLYKPFSAVTLQSLHHALAESSESLSKEAIETLMKAYDSLDTFPDVEPALNAVAADPSIDAYVFSNGTDAMVSSSVKSSPSLSPHSKVFRDLITIEAVACYKPDPRVYQYLAEKVWNTAGGATQERVGGVWLVSGNPFDVVGARAAGLQAVWVDRAGGHRGMGGWNDRLGELVEGGGVGPTVVVKGVDEAVKAIQEWTEGHGATGEGRRDGGDGKVDAAIGPG
jgi:2-haloacid dehalogenase